MSDISKSLWRERHTRPWSFYCPQCRAPRKLAHHPDPGRLANYVRVALCAAVFTIAAWRWFEWKGIVSFVPFWAIYELYYRTRIRGVLACPHCGFDPYLYLVDSQLARQEIEKHWKKKFAEHGIPFPAPKHGGVMPAEAHLTSPSPSAAKETQQYSDGESP
jgi:hypothetical protein